MRILKYTGEKDNKNVIIETGNNVFARWLRDNYYSGKIFLHKNTLNTLNFGVIGIFNDYISVSGRFNISGTTVPLIVDISKLNNNQKYLTTISIIDQCDKVNMLPENQLIDFDMKVFLADKKSAKNIKKIKYPDSEREETRELPDLSDIYKKLEKYFSSNLLYDAAERREVFKQQISNPHFDEKEHIQYQVLDEYIEGYYNYFKAGVLKTLHGLPLENRIKNHDEGNKIGYSRFKFYIYQDTDGYYITARYNEYGKKDANSIYEESQKLNLPKILFETQNKNSIFQYISNKLRENLLNDEQVIGDKTYTKIYLKNPRKKPENKSASFTNTNTTIVKTTITTPAVNTEVTPSFVEEVKEILKNYKDKNIKLISAKILTDRYNNKKFSFLINVDKEPKSFSIQVNKKAEETELKRQFYTAFCTYADLERSAYNKILLQSKNSGKSLFGLA